MKYKLLIILFFGAGLFITVRAQKNFNVVVTAGGGDAGIIHKEEPLVIRMVLVNRQAQSAANWNLAANARMEELERLKSEHRISDSVFQAEKEFIRSQRRVAEVSTIGSGVQPWTGMVTWKISSADGSRTYNWPIKLLSNPRPVPVAVLDENAFYAAYYGMDPGMMNQVADGKYVIVGKIGEVASDPVAVFVDRRSVEKDSLAHLTLLAKYYWHKGDGNTSLQFAEMILEKNPRLLSGLVIKADALCLNRSLLPALEIYNLALEEYYKLAGTQAEPPDYILDMIWAIKKELNGN